MMTKLKYTALLLLSAFFCAGCLEHKQVFTFQEDGSLMVNLTYTVAEDAIPTMKACHQAVAGWSNQTTDNWFGNEKAVREFYTNPDIGLSVDHYGQFPRNGKRITEITIVAKDAAKALEYGYFGNASLKKDPDGTTRFTLAFPKDKLNASPEEIKRLRTLCGDLYISIQVITPSKAIAHNGARRSDTHTVWHFSADGRGVDIFGLLPDIGVVWKEPMVVKAPVKK